MSFTADLPFDDLIVQGHDHTLRCPLHRDGEIVAPTSGTVTVYDARHRRVVDAAPVEVIDGVATYTIPSAVTASLQRGEGWLVEWDLVVEGKPLPTARNKAALVRTHLYPVVTDAIIWRRMPALDPHREGTFNTRRTYQPQLDEAWADILGRLAADGTRPNLITSPSALREVHLYLTLALILDDMDAGTNERWGEAAERYRAFAEKAWERLSFDYDSDDNGRANKRKRAVQGVWLCGR